MPNRILRDVTDSEKINLLSCQAEVLFYRLIMKADDYGAFHAKPSLIKASVFPLRLDKVRETDISRWLTECEKAGLIAFYESDSKPFLVILNFGQRMRSMKKRFPAPPGHLLQSAASCGNSPPEYEVESETETEYEVEKKTGFAGILKNDSLFFEQVAQAWNINRKAYLKMIDDFMLVLSSKNKSHPDQREFKSHFFNWAKQKFSQYQQPEQKMHL